MNKGSSKSTRPAGESKAEGQKAPSPKAKSAIENQHPETKQRSTTTRQPPAATHHAPTPKPMEVHHHPQLEHKPKPWKEYLLEGFMIFIAVMMGFIAENVREDITNNEHVRQLTAQLVRDLRADTLQLSKMLDFETQIAKRNDTLFTLLQQPFQKADIKKIEQLVANSHGLWPFHSSMGAIGAIKNELHLKQFSNSMIIGYIASYERHVDLMHTVQDITLIYQRTYLDPFLTQHFTPANLEAAFNKPSALNDQARNLTQADLTQLAADMVLIRINTNELIKDNEQVKVDAVSLLKYVETQYHPE